MKINKKNLIKELRRRERLHYSSEMCQMQEVTSWKQLKEYCEGTPTVNLLGEDGYLIYTKDEIVDLTGTSPKDTLVALLNLRKEFKHKTVSADFRDTTSYPLIMAARRAVEITNHEEWLWGGELMHHIEFSFK